MPGRKPTKTALIIVAVAMGPMILLPVILWAVWALIPPLSPHSLGKTEHFVSAGGMDTYHERYGSCPPVILIPAGGSQMSTWRFNIGALSGSREVWTLDLSSPNISALVLGRILVCSDRDFRPPTTSQKQKHLTSLNQPMEAL